MPVGWVQRSVSHRNSGRNDKHGNESMGCGAMRLHPSYGLGNLQDADVTVGRLLRFARNDGFTELIRDSLTQW